MQNSRGGSHYTRGFLIYEKQKKNLNLFTYIIKFLFYYHNSLMLGSLFAKPHPFFQQVAWPSSERSTPVLELLWALSAVTSALLLTQSLLHRMPSATWCLYRWRLPWYKGVLKGTGCAAKLNSHPTRIRRSRHLAWWPTSGCQFWLPAGADPKVSTDGSRNGVSVGWRQAWMELADPNFGPSRLEAPASI